MNKYQVVFQRKDNLKTIHINGFNKCFNALRVFYRERANPQNEFVRFQVVSAKGRA